MFGQNEIIGKNFFRNIDENELFVTSIFGPTLQGEGPFRGEPAFFIRLAKCNLACNFCDTFFDDGEWMTFDEIDNKIESTIEQFYMDQGMDRPAWTTGKRKMVLVMTGGEPLLQENIYAFLTNQENNFHATQIESNGTQGTEIPFNTTLVCSPKCFQKNGKPIRYLKPRSEILERANCLKFVMSADENSPYSSVPDWVHKWKEETDRDVFVSPMNIYQTLPKKSKELRAKKEEFDIEKRSSADEIVSFWEKGLLNMDENQKNHEYTAKYCVSHGFILNLQVHLFASLA